MTAWVGTASAVAAATLGLGAASALADACPNAALRAQTDSSHLPNCRGYEMVSPLEKNGADVGLGSASVRASVDGGAVAYDSNGAFPPAVGTGKSGMVTYLARRGVKAWSSEGITPEHGPDAQSGIFTGPVYRLLAQDLSKGVVYTADPPLVPGAQEGIRHLYLRDNTTGSFDLLSVPFAPLPPPSIFDSFYLPLVSAATPDFGHVIFRSTKNLTENAAGDSGKLYEWDHGTLRLAGVLPGEVPAGSSDAGMGLGGYMQSTNTISRDGSKIFFTDPENGEGLYVRIDHSSTAQVNDSENTITPVVPGAAKFRAATPDGSRVFFTSSQRLTDDDVNDSADLYVYDTTKPASDPHNLTLLSRGDHSAGDDPDALGVLGVSDAGDEVYFAATGRLVEGQPTTGGTGVGIYMWKSGSLRFVARVGEGANSQDGGNWISDNYELSPPSSRVSADGRYLLFSTLAPQPNGYDNAGQREFYRYDAASSTTLDPVVDCVSCNPDGAPPLGDAEITRLVTGGPIPYPYVPRAMSADGSRIFFHTRDTLDPRDVNGRLDVYQWEEGELSLLSTGRGESDSFFVDASGDGDQVFFQTRDQIAGVDRDANRDLYVASVGGGLEQAAPTRPDCGADACQGPASVPSAGPAAGSISFDGHGNVRSDRASVSVARLKPVVGLASSLRVRVPGAGRISLAGAMVRRASRGTGKAGTYKVKIILNSRARRALKNGGRLKARMTLKFRSESGRTVSKAFTVTFVRPKGGR